MWAQYKRMLWFTQVLICLVTLGVLHATQYLWPVAMVFFVAMQVSALFGAFWAARLKRKIEGPSW